MAINVEWYHIDTVVQGNTHYSVVFMFNVCTFLAFMQGSRI